MRGGGIGKCVGAYANSGGGFRYLPRWLSPHSRWRSYLARGGPKNSRAQATRPKVMRALISPRGFRIERSIAAAVAPGVDPERPEIAGPAQGRRDLLHGPQELVPVLPGEVGMEVDPLELPLAVDPLAMDAHDFQAIRTEQRGDAEVLRPLHPGLEEERTVDLEEPLHGPARLGIGEGRTVPFYVPEAAGGGERGLDDPGRRGGPEDAVELREGLHHPGSGQGVADLLRHLETEGPMVDDGDDGGGRRGEPPEQIVERRVPGNPGGGDEIHLDAPRRRASRTRPGPRPPEGDRGADRIRRPAAAAPGSPERSRDRSAPGSTGGLPPGRRRAAAGPCGRPSPGPRAAARPGGPRARPR